MAETLLDRDVLAERVERDLTLHPPAEPHIGSAMDGLREWAKWMAMEVVQRVPEGREKSTALTKIEEALMWAVAGVARNQDLVLDPGEEEVVVPLVVLYPRGADEDAFTKEMGRSVIELEQEALKRFRERAERSG